jgi:outer membrane lipoprotein SlyB
MRPSKAAVAIFAGILLLAGCANSLGGGSYSRRDARQVYTVLFGEIAGVNPVRIEGEATGIGTAGGAAIGYSLGRVISDGDSGRVAGAIAGTAGAVAGRELEKSLTADDGLEITVRMDRGDTLLIVQSADVAFHVGERVRVLRGQGAEARVLKN